MKEIFVGLFGGYIFALFVNLNNHFWPCQILAIIRQTEQTIRMGLGGGGGGRGGKNENRSYRFCRFVIIICFYINCTASTAYRVSARNCDIREEDLTFH